MFYVKLNDDGNVDRYPYTLTDLIRSTPNVSFPKQVTNEVAASFNVYPVTPSDRPAADHTLNFDRTAVLQDGVWVEVWSSTPATAEEIAERVATQSESVRYERNALLTESDWTQLSDSPVDTPAWGTYRQALRDIPSQAGFPFDVTWPDKP